MQNSTTPCLRAEVVVRPFDAVEGDCRFLVAVDDRHFLVSAAVAAVLEASRQPGTLVALAARASARLGLDVSPDQVRTLLSEHAPPVLFGIEKEASTRRGPIRFQRILASAERLRPLLELAARLFGSRASILMAVMFVGVELLVAVAHAGPRAAMNAADVAIAVALTLLGVAVHESGHLAACLRYGAPHGGIGMGLYWCFPVFYAEVHGAWMLTRRQRAVVDAGGVYFQCGYVLVLGLIYLVTGAPAFLAAIAWTHLLMLHTLNPVMKYDGYWLLSDLTGISNLHQRIRAIAQRAWRAFRVRQLQCFPDPRELILLSVFATAAGTYFVYLIFMLGWNVAAVASQLVEAWSVTREGWVQILQAIGQAALLTLLVMMSVSVAFLIARSLRAVTQEDTNDR